MEKTYKLKKNKVVGFGGSHYTNDNITDEVAFKMITQSRSNAGHFENAEQLLKNFDGQSSTGGINTAKTIIVDAEKFEQKKEEPVTAPAPAAKIEVKVTEKKKGRPVKK